MHTVFVYGTLKRGFSNFGLLKNSSFLGTALSARPSYHMFDTGGFPVLRETNELDGGSVSGEVFEVDNQTFERLDRLEGNGFMYQREQHLFKMDDKEVKAWVYIGMPSAFNYDRLWPIEPKEGVLTYARD